MPKCDPNDLDAAKKCWVIKDVGATLYQGANCTDRGKKTRRVPLNPADRRIRAAIREVLEKRK
jgi:hypothetical protein